MREILFRMYDGVKMVYDGLVIYDGELYEDWRAFEDGFESDNPLMQYTGLDDKNGVKIYEGDILRNVDNPHVDKLLFKVIWSKHYGAWFWWALEGDRMDYLGQSITEDCEVIGNIYDNPELMREKK